MTNKNFHFDLFKSFDSTNHLEHIVRNTLEDNLSVLKIVPFHFMGWNYMELGLCLVYCKEIVYIFIVKHFHLSIVIWCLKIGNGFFQPNRTDISKSEFCLWIFAIFTDFHAPYPRPTKISSISISVGNSCWCVFVPFSWKNRWTEYNETL